MKKLTLFLLFTNFLQFGYGQTFQVGNELETLNNLHNVFSNDKYWINCYSEHPSWMTMGYEVINLESSERKLSGPIKRTNQNKSGYLLNFFEKGGFLFELTVFYKTAVNPAKGNIGLIKRRITDFEQVDSIEWLGEYKLSTPTSCNNLALYYDEDGITIVSSESRVKSNIKPFISRYDFELNLKWKIEPEELQKEDVHIVNYSGNENGGGLLVVCTGVGDTKMGLGSILMTPSELSFLIVDPKGFVVSVKPKFGEADVVFTDGDFYYDFEKQIVTGVGLIAKKLDDYRYREDMFGYAYFQCGIDGTTKVYKQDFFSYGDVYTKESGQYIVKMEGSWIDGIDSDKPLPRIKIPRFMAFRDGNNGYVVHVLFSEGSSLPQRPFFFGLNNQGEITWERFIPRLPVKRLDGFSNYTDYFFLKNNQLNWFDVVPKSILVEDNGLSEMLPELNKNDDGIPARVTLDCNNGDLNYFGLFPNMEKEMKFDAFYGFAKVCSVLYFYGFIENDAILLRYVNETNQNTRLVNCKFD